LMTPLVDSGECELTARCWDSHERTGGTVTIPPREIRELTRIGCLEEGWRLIGEMNSDGATTP
jgi:hypothetical protein